MSDAVVPEIGSIGFLGKAATQPAAEALRLLLADTRSADTRRAYEADLRDFFTWRTGSPVSPSSLADFCALPSGPLALALNGYKAHLRERDLAESTVNRRLSAVRSLLRMARRLGAPGADPAGLVTSEKTKTYRDTRGPALSEVRRLLAAPDTSTLPARTTRPGVADAPVRECPASRRDPQV